MATQLRESRGSSSPALAFNFLPVRFSAEQFEGGLVAFESPEQLTALRLNLAGTHVVTRTRSGIACIPLTTEADLRGEPTSFATRDHRTLTMHLVQEALTRSVLDWGYRLRRRQPPEFVSRLKGKDLLEPFVRGRQFENLGQLHVYPQFRLDARSIGPSDCPGVVVGVKTRYEIDMTVSELIARGVKVEGLYVFGTDESAASDPTKDVHTARLCHGMIHRIEGGKLLLRDAQNVEHVAADRVWLECRLETFNDVLATLAGPDSTRITKELKKATFDLLGAFGRYERSIEIAQRLGRQPLDIAQGLSVSIGPPVGSSNGRRVRWTFYNPPTFRFDQAGDKTDRSADRGLDQHGPFDVEFFTKKKPRICVVAPRMHKGVVENFMTKFLNGVQGERVFSRGFIRKYHLSGCEVVMHVFDGGLTDAAAYREACRDALQDGAIDLAIVITSEAQTHLTGDDSPYLVAKSTFMGQGVPVQEVKIETVRLAKLAYPLNSIALACYAKLGGIPFVIAAPRALAHELVIGIGSAHVKPHRFAAPERYVGITTVFSSDGNYLLSNTSREAAYNDYPKELLRSMTACINDIKVRNAWQRGDELRLIFHVFKPLKDLEAIAVKKLVERLAGEYAKVEFAFIHVSTEHDWVMFDRASPGIRNSWETGEGPGKGHYAPDCGYAVQIGNREMLVSTGGLFGIKSALHGAPKPMLLKLHRESTFADIEYLAQQAYRFTSMSWRNMYPARIPVTILYSDLIADLLGHLSHVRHWNPDIIATKLRHSRWFL